MLNIFKILKSDQVLHYSKEDVSRLAIDQLNIEHLEIAVASFNGFANTFGKEWIEQLFMGNQVFPFVLEIEAMWNSWVAIKDLEGAAKIRKRWKNGIHENGVRTEVYCASFLAKSGFNVILEPKLSTGRKADLSIKYNNNASPTFIEISKRGESLSNKRATEILQRLCNKLSPHSTYVHNKLVLLRSPTDAELIEIEKWIPKAIQNENDIFLDLAVFKRDTADCIAADEWLLELAPKYSLKATKIANNSRCTVAVGVDDNSARKYISKEAEQLPMDSSGIILLDTSSIIGDFEIWLDQVQNWFTPNDNKNVSAIVVFTVRPSTKGVQVAGKILENPYTDFQILPEVKSVLYNFLTANMNSISLD